MPRVIDVKTYSEKRDHFYDDYKNIGYKYEGNIMRKVLSPDMFANPMNDVPMRQIERLVEFLIDAARKIPLHFGVTYEKDSELIN